MKTELQKWLELINYDNTKVKEMKNKTPIWFACVDFPEACPEECPYLITTTDGFGTGDSPTQYECSCLKVKGCPLYQEI